MLPLYYSPHLNTLFKFNKLSFQPTFPSRTHIPLPYIFPPNPFRQGLTFLDSGKFSEIRRGRECV
jgi:hypothetical protein